MSTCIETNLRLLSRCLLTMHSLLPLISFFGQEMFVSLNYNTKQQLHLVKKSPNIKVMVDNVGK